MAKKKSTETTYPQIRMQESPQQSFVGKSKIKSCCRVKTKSFLFEHHVYHQSAVNKNQLITMVVFCDFKLCLLLNLFLVSFCNGLKLNQRNSGRRVRKTSIKHIKYPCSLIAIKFHHFLLKNK